MPYDHDPLKYIDRRPVPRHRAEMVSEVLTDIVLERVLLEFNPDHDERGRFASGSGGASPDAGKAPAAGHEAIHGVLSVKGWKVDRTVEGDPRAGGFKAIAVTEYTHSDFPGHMVRIEGPIPGGTKGLGWMHQKGAENHPLPEYVKSGYGVGGLNAHLWDFGSKKGGAAPGPETGKVTTKDYWRSGAFRAGIQAGHAASRAGKGREEVRAAIRKAVSSKVRSIVTRPMRRPEWQ